MPHSVRESRQKPLPLKVRWDRVGALLASIITVLLLLLRGALPEHAVPTAAAVSAIKPPAVATVANAESATSRRCDPGRSGQVWRQSANDTTGAVRTVALTFDDGPSIWTPQILAVLNKYGVPATFFVVGQEALRRPEMVRDEAAAGYAIENHSWSHPITSRTSGWRTADLNQEIDRTQALLANLTGGRPCVFRPPGGIVKGAQDGVARRGMSIALWSVDTEDWRVEKPGSTLTSASVKAIVSEAETGLRQHHPVLLMHDGGGRRAATLAALPSIIAAYRSHGYVFVKIDGRAAEG